MAFQGSISFVEVTAALGWLLEHGLFVLGGLSVTAAAWWTGRALSRPRVALGTVAAPSQAETPQQDDVLERLQAEQARIERDIANFDGERDRIIERIAAARARNDPMSEEVLARDHWHTERRLQRAYHTLSNVKERYNVIRDLTIKLRYERTQGRLAEQEARFERLLTNDDRDRTRQDIEIHKLSRRLGEHADVVFPEDRHDGYGPSREEQERNRAHIEAALARRSLQTNGGRSGPTPDDGGRRDRNGTNGDGPHPRATEPVAEVTA